MIKLRIYFNILTPASIYMLLCVSPDCIMTLLVRLMACSFAGISAGVDRLPRVR